MPTSEGSQGYLVVTERRKNDRSVTLYAVSGTHCGNGLIITGKNRSRSFGILSILAFYCAEDYFRYLLVLGELFGEGLRASGFL